MESWGVEKRAQRWVWWLFGSGGPAGCRYLVARAAGPPFTCVQARRAPEELVAPLPSPIPEKTYLLRSAEHRPPPVITVP
ncbi:hypothetical protein O3P69_000101 [Scylla paramamosain]|uniref:Secreted protein n=1 Tax=Scylla paramamosain TaxID=85552 RepID=A0AAW0UUG2_SCYPA